MYSHIYPYIVKQRLSGEKSILSVRKEHIVVKKITEWLARGKTRGLLYAKKEEKSLIKDKTNSK